MKKLINVLWAIEKDLSVIASNTEAPKNKPLRTSKMTVNVDTDKLAAKILAAIASNR